MICTVMVDICTIDVNEMKMEILKIENRCLSYVLAIVSKYINITKKIGSIYTYINILCE